MNLWQRAQKLWCALCRNDISSSLNRHSYSPKNQMTLGLENAFPLIPDLNFNMEKVKQESTTK